MPRSLSSPAGRALLILGLLLVLLLVAFDLSRPGSVLLSFWTDLFQGQTPVEGIRDDLVDGLGIPR